MPTLSRSCPATRKRWQLSAQRLLTQRPTFVALCFFPARDEKKESLKSYTVLKFRSTERTFETTTTYSPPQGKSQTVHTLQDDDVDMVPSSAVATQHEPGLMTESVKHLDKP